MINSDAIFGKARGKSEKPKKPKMTTQKLPELERIQQVIDRLELFVDILVNDLELRELDDEESFRVHGQLTAYATSLTLLRQVKKRGELWRGGYLDNTGVVYVDQVAEHYRHQENLKSLAQSGIPRFIR